MTDYLSPDDDRYWPLDFASKMLGPPEIEVGDLRTLVAVLGLRPVGLMKMNNGRGRPSQAYDASELSELYAWVQGFIASKKY